MPLPGLDHEVGLATQHPVDQRLGQLDGRLGVGIQVGGVDAAVGLPGAQVPPAAG